MMSIDDVTNWIIENNLKLNMKIDMILIYLLVILLKLIIKKGILSKKKQLSILLHLKVN